MRKTLSKAVLVKISY